jgi:hypothetical protein
METSVSPYTGLSRRRLSPARHRGMKSEQQVRLEGDRSCPNAMFAEVVVAEEKGSPKAPSRLIDVPSPRNAQSMTRDGDFLRHVKRSPHSAIDLTVDDG